MRKFCHILFYGKLLNLKKNKNEKEFMKLKGQDILKGGKRNLRKRPIERGKDPAFSLWNVAITFYSFLFTFNPLKV